MADTRKKRRKQRRRAIRHPLEYAGAVLGLWLFDLLPAAAARAVARAVADAWFILCPSRRRIAVENITRSGLVPTPGQARAIARESFRHFAVIVVESLKSGRVFSESTWRDHVELDIPQETLALLEDERQGVLLVSGHLGNWEIAAQLLSYLKPVVGITRAMNNPRVNDLIEKRKPRNRFRLTPKHDADSGRFLSTLKQGDMLALLIDQHAVARGMPIEFFGRPASTHTSPALLHLVTGAPLCFGYCLRRGPFDYVLKALPPIVHKPTGRREADVRAILERLTRELEHAIRECPEQYLWAHRRWRS